MIIDTSAIIAILRDEAGASDYGAAEYLQLPLLKPLW